MRKYNFLKNLLAFIGLILNNEKCSLGQAFSFGKIVNLYEHYTTKYTINVFV